MNPASSRSLSGITRRAVLSAAGGVLVAPVAFGQTRAWPERPIKVIVPNGPGSSVDTVGRVACIEIARLLGQPMVMDNRAGAAGAIGVEATRNSAPDGYTLLMGSSSAISVAPLLQKAVTYDGPRDFEMVSMLALLPNVLVCNPQLPVQNTRDLIAWARGKGDDAHMASAGIGSASHLAGLAFQAAAGFKSMHVPYKGGAQGVASVVSGETDWVLTPAPAAMGLVASGRLRLLGHSMGPDTRALGNTPSLASTVPGFEFSGWIGLMAPKGTPTLAIDAMAKATAAALQQPDVLKVYQTNGAVAHSSTPQEFRTYLVRDIDLNKKAVAMAGLQAE